MGACVVPPVVAATKRKGGGGNDRRGEDRERDRTRHHHLTPSEREFTAFTNQGCSADIYNLFTRVSLWAWADEVYCLGDGRIFSTLFIGR